ncbi:isoprenoid synthase domain-containing protein [Xylariales sp. PMI_506]|nr:isoprenoid synthase domain-containing protein [Xylariales sp. PMI_506]
MDERAAKRSRKINLAFLSASMTPRADAIGLRLLSGWNHWGFPWDDRFDEGPFKFNTIEGIQEIVETLAVLDETHPPVSADMEPLKAAMGLDLARHVREHPAILGCEAAIVDIITIHNDILSMRKELEYGAENNLIKWLLDLGFTPQEAMDKTGAMLDACFAEWHANRAQVPSWNIETDDRVKELLDIFRDLALGSLNWSFVTVRYLDKQGGDVRRTRILTLKVAE